MKEENKNIKQKIQPKNKGKNLVEENKKLVKELNELKAQVTKLTNDLETANKNNNELVNKVKLAQAELINYRKRKDEEVSGMLKYANEDILRELIGVTDNFERAIKLDDNNLNDELSKFLEGFKLMYATLVGILNKYGIEEINRVGEIFDPKQEEALITDKVEGHKNEEVLEVLLKGYKLHDKVIRPASVKVNIN
ncbi:MAG: nucleotide exchange factor GrpE [Bacilli bacterium]|nr:nucleotide exchange factor GrpE [Bacilli bacterium]